MELGFGGPVWHASGKSRGGQVFASREIAERALKGVGDVALGEWRDYRNGVYHIRRRLSAGEVEQSGLFMRDVRGTAEERERMMKLIRAEPRLLAFLGVRSSV